MVDGTDKSAFVSDVCGPVGRRIAERLLSEGYQVAGVDGRAGAMPAPDGVAIREWPKKPGAFGHTLNGVSLVVIPDLAALPPDADPDEQASRIAGLINAAAKKGVERLVLINSAAVYAPEALQAGQVTEAAPVVGQNTEDPLARAAIAIERAAAEAHGDMGCVVLRSLPALARDCPAAQTMIGEMWRTGRPLAGGGAQMQGIDADELAELTMAATRTPAAVGQAINVAGPIAVAAESAAAESRRLGMMLVDDTDTSIRVRPEYPVMAPILQTSKAAALLRVKPRKRIWVSLAEVLQTLIRQDRASGKLPAVRSSLPPALTAIEAGKTPLEGSIAVVTDTSTAANEHLVSLLLRLGANVSAIARADEDAAALRARFGPFLKSGALTILTGDMALMQDVRDMAGALAKTHDRIDLLYNTMARLHDTREDTEEGQERTFAANLLGPFLLTNLLAELIQAAPQPRIFNVISDIYADAPVDLQDLQGKIMYAPAPALGRAHAGQVLCASVLAELGQGSAMKVICVSPRPERSETWRLPPLTAGDEMIGAQEMQRRESIRSRMVMQMTSPRDVANHLADLAVLPDPGGPFLTFDGPAEPVGHVRDRNLAGALWNACRSLAGLDG